MGTDRITQVWIQGLRSVEDQLIELSGLTVLIGDNGTGKSTILEALELLRLAGSGGKFAQDVLHRRHGGFRSLLRRGAREIRLGVRVEGDGPVLDYNFTVVPVGSSPEIGEERLRIREHATDLVPELVVLRSGTSGAVKATRLDPSVPELQLLSPAQHSFSPTPGTLAEPGALVLPGLAAVRGPGAFSRVVSALQRIDTQVPFETRPLWQQAELDTRQGPRRDIELMETDRLERYGVNLPNAYHQLRNTGGEVWNRVIARGKLGLGEDLTDFKLVVVGRGRIELSAVFSGLAGLAVPAESLSDGQIAYLAFIALCELNPARSLLAFDEPELHLHPALLTRVLFMLEEVAQRHPVILSTHSDRLLDALSDPAKQVVLCELDENRATQLVRPNKERLDTWMQEYRGLGSIRADGYEPHVFDPTPPDDQTP